MKIILDNIDGKKTKVLAGRDKGEEARKLYKLDEIDETQDSLDVIVPKEIYSVNSSYFLGLFGQSVRKFGREKFLLKYRFECDNIIMRIIENGIEDALKTDSSLDI